MAGQNASVMVPLRAPDKQSFALISHLRWIAALLVVIQHVHQNVLAPYKLLLHQSVIARLVYGISGYGHVAVLVFFVISGFLVGGKAFDLLSSSNIKRDSWQFLVDRFSRIFIVLIPSLVVAAAALLLMLNLHPMEPFVFGSDSGYALAAPMAHDLHLSSWVRAALLLNGFFGGNLNCNAPLWSLAYEWFYYIAALALVLLYRRSFSLWGVLIMGYATVLCFAAALATPSIFIGALVWLSGAGARIALRAKWVSGNIFRYSGVVLVTSLLVVERFHTVNDLLWGVAIAFMIANTSWTTWHFASHTADYLSKFSYSLYVTHFPLMLACMATLHAIGVLPSRQTFSLRAVCIALGIVVITVLFAKAFASLTEDRTKLFRNWILNLRKPVLIEIKGARATSDD